MAITFSSDGKTLVTGGMDGAVRQWDVLSLEQIALLKPEKSGVPTSLAFSLDNKLLCVGHLDRAPEVWNVNTGKLETRLKVEEPIFAWAVAVSKLGLVAASNRRSIAVYDLNTQRRLPDLHGHTSIVSSLAFSPDGKTLASGSWDKSVRLWRVAN